MADAPDLQGFHAEGSYQPLQGKVPLFNSCDAEAEPIMSIKHTVTPDLRPVLKKIADQYSPIQSEFLFLCFCSLFKEFDQRVYVLENDMWAVRGRYSKAIEDDELVVWKPEHHGLVLPILIVSSCSFFWFVF